MVYRYFSLFLLLLLSGCATAPVKPVLVNRGIEIETLQGPVSVALESPAGKTGGRGIFIYRRPDQFRLTLITPFGQVLMDIIARGDDLLCLNPSQKKGWRGPMRDLPESLGARIWPLMRWVLEPRIAGPANIRDFERPDGTYEKVYFDADGLVQRKTSSLGDEVSYSDYHNVAGVVLPNVIEIATREGSRLKLTFDEPEVNQPVEDEIMAPPLDGIELLPLAGLPGF